MKKIMIAAIAALTLGTPLLMASNYAIEKQFKNAMDTKDMAEAFADAGESCNWQLESENADTMMFTKRYTQKSKYFNHPAYRGKRTYSYQDVTFTVSMRNNGFSLQTDTLPENERLQERIKNDIDRFSSRFYTNLLPSVL